MRINHNIAALNTYRQLSNANNANSNSMEKLSSGLRINRAGDDAAGLAISEKMRGQIRGLEQAQTNAQDGISMIQTAEGALNESHSILQRMRELSVQSSNDTNTAEDRAELQKEVDQLSQELTRVSENTEFNTQKLLDGSFSGKFQIGANQDQSITVTTKDMGAAALNVAEMTYSGTASTTTTDANGLTDSVTDTNYAGANGDVSLTLSDDFSMTTNYSTTGTDAADVKSGTFSATQTGVSITYTEGNSDSTIQEGEIAIAGGDGNWSLKSGTYDATNDEVVFENTNGDTFTWNTTGMATGSAETFDVVANNTYDGSVDVVNADGVKETIDLSGHDPSTETITTTDGLDVDLADTLTSANAGQNFSVSVSGMTETGSSTKGIDISSQDAANDAISVVDKAIQDVSAERSKMGAYQNRLEHTINNLGTSSENLTAAESRIRDVDMAKEMMNQTKSSILAQASQSMLAKANQQPQGVLQLLR